ncbi:hypothetical protein CRG98_004728 [Punica granatum]|uniref:Uncharacterized protein n=1 Tax=Punica granatum TaxID=22663 RepID=A0A2I0L490_PUNGR|nr:hypothetical protein CRG98_004728 [Punica granatum]
MGQPQELSGRWARSRSPLYRAGAQRGFDRSSRRRKMKSSSTFTASPDAMLMVSSKRIGGMGLLAQQYASEPINSMSGFMYQRGGHQ